MAIFFFFQTDTEKKNTARTFTSVLVFSCLESRAGHKVSFRKLVLQLDCTFTLLLHLYYGNLGNIPCSKLLWAYLHETFVTCHYTQFFQLNFFNSLHAAHVLSIVRAI